MEGRRLAFDPSNDPPSRESGSQQRLELKSFNNAYDALVTTEALQMATREYRLAEFSQERPPSSKPLQVLCEDKSGTYLLPFQCEWREGVWYAADKKTPVEAQVVGWRMWQP